MREGMFAGLLAVSGAVWLAGCGAPRGVRDTASAGPAIHEASACPAAGDPDVAATLLAVREEHPVPAVGAAIVSSRGLEELAVVGVRKSGSSVAVTTNDLWHLGSETKAMTATLVGRLVERGLLRWETTVAEVFPEWNDEFQAEARGITVRQLLAHRAGLPRDVKWQEVSQSGSVSEQRLRVTREALAARPESAPGTMSAYSNLGYVIVGAIVERVTGRCWEEELRQEVFGPLGMQQAGFGGMGTRGKTDQPWGHMACGRVAGNGPEVDNPPVLGPAGRVHASLSDWARFVVDQLRGARGSAALLDRGTYVAMHTPVDGGSYALGWMVLERDWGGGGVLHHTGCNTMHYANVWVAPKRDFAILVCVNQGDDTAFRATDAVVSALVRRQLATRDDGAAGGKRTAQRLEGL